MEGSVTTAPEDLRAGLAVESSTLGAPYLDGESAVEVVDHRPTVLESLRDAWNSRQLLRPLATAILLVYLTKYRLGPFWLMLQTFMAIAGYSLIFGGGIFNVKAPNGMPYFLFTIVGMMGWQLFQTTTILSTMSFLRLKTLIREINIPLLLIPIAGSAQALLRFFFLFVGYVIAVIVFWAHDGRLYVQLEPKYLFFSVAGLFLCLAAAWGLSLWTAPLTAHTRDVRLALRFMLPFWMFVTPVLFPIEKIHGKTRLVAELNPLSSPVEMTKVGMVGAGSVRLYAAIWSVALIGAVFASGIWFVTRFGAWVIRKEDEGDEFDEMMM